MKTCRTCNIDKPMDEYYRHDTYADGRFAHCMECMKIKAKNKAREKRANSKD